MTGNFALANFRSAAFSLSPTDECPLGRSAGITPHILGFYYSQLVSLRSSALLCASKWRQAHLERRGVHRVVIGLSDGPLQAVEKVADDLYGTVMETRGSNARCRLFQRRAISVVAAVSSRNQFQRIETRSSKHARVQDIVLVVAAWTST